MTAEATPVDRRAATAGAGTSRRHRAMRVIAAFMAVAAVGFGLFTIALGVLDPAQGLHAFHNALVASLLLVISAPPAIAVARAPERAERALVILAVVGVAALGTMLLSATLDPFTLPFVVLIGVLWLLRRGGGLIVPAGRSSLPLVVLAVAAAIPLLAYAAGQAELSRLDRTSEHAAFFHWVEASFIAAAVALLGLLAAVRPVAYRLAAWTAGVSLVVLGGASVVLGGYASAFDAGWGLAALVWGILLVAAAEWVVRRE